MLRFTFGIQKDHVIPVPNTIDFNGMTWPPQLSGGVEDLYHNMRLEGKYLEGVGRDEEASFLTHTGPTAGIDRTFLVELPINVVIDESEADLIVEMNVNKWFQNPNLYDFSTIVPPQIMGNAGLQEQLLQNGSDVFTIAVDA